MEKARLKKTEIEEIKAKIPYATIDKRLVKLVRLLNSFDDVFTQNAYFEPYITEHMDFNEWSIVFRVNQSKSGWISLEFLIWLFNCDLGRGDYDIVIGAFAPPPFAKGKLGSCLQFTLDGRGISPNELAEEVEKLKAEFYKKTSWVFGH